MNTKTHNIFLHYVEAGGHNINYCCVYYLLIVAIVGDWGEAGIAFLLKNIISCILAQIIFKRVKPQRLWYVPLRFKGVFYYFPAWNFGNHR